ncbi:MAG: ADP-forming succinate--CoA ligase subunit beta [Bacillati bacterium ANGP1]|uniref:ADP-forming succinate--CoA ligase subunit beta n=1 Tax=Candidatus Segetimicrobium genomatis TaxID=2569760 RepID=A0A537IY17_9BACT|nr:MAG: ADP-forming succinate--CoA ligase subunit beta [Terrabacteria group bacterium ANGP1]
MKLHEYQAKELFAKYAIPIQKGVVIDRPEQVDGLALKYPLVLKAQVLVGGRGKAGGIKLAATAGEARRHAATILGMEIKGEKVRRLLVAEAAELGAEYYVAFTVDRAARRMAVITSAAGGIDIEEVARTTPDQIVRGTADPFLGVQSYHTRQLGRRTGLTGSLLSDYVGITTALYRLCVAEDAELAEINPLAVVAGRLLAVDAKVIIDDNAVYRHPSLPKNEELTELEAAARAEGLSYVELEGDLAIIGNGAGLVMSTLDMVAYFGGRPAENMKQAIEIVVRKPGVRGLFINIFGGITRCDDIARGIVDARPPVGMVVRLTGTNEEEGRRILQAAGIHAYIDPEEAAQRAVALASQQ